MNKKIPIILVVLLLAAGAGSYYLSYLACKESAQIQRGAELFLNHLTIRSIHIPIFFTVFVQYPS